ncbi:Frataxin, partial [Polychaeton citri CBS 116435]
RFFSVLTSHQISLMPEHEDPPPPKQTELDNHPTSATDVSDEEYHQHADEFMNLLHDEAEAIQETREDVEVEYASGVLSVTFPPNGSYVINKQPPNKQIWVSSPLSGPKRYDWVVRGEGMHQKEGAGVGDWVYLRDGTSLPELLRKELGITIDVQRDVDSLKPAVDATE